ncbi:restriction endonuclease subunit S [Ottowia caeni]
MLRPDPSKVDGRFLLYALQSPYLQHQIGWNEGTGSTVSNLRIPVLEALQVPTPPVLEQKAVAETLGAIDDRITLLRETNATLEAIAQALFKSWFLDFDPVRAKMEGRTPEGMDEATAALFPDGFEASELGEVPRGWKYSTAGESFVLTMGQSPPGGTYNESGEGLAFYQGRTDFGFRFPTQRVFCSAPTRYAEPGDTLVSVRAPVGDVNMALERCCIGRGVASVRHPSGFRGFTFYAMRGLGARFKAFDSEGTVFGSISKKDFQNLPVVVAPETVLRAYDEVTSPIDQRIVENEVMLRALSSLRDTLLPRLISGQLRLPEAMAALEATL